MKIVAQTTADSKENSNQLFLENFGHSLRPFVAVGAMLALVGCTETISDEQKFNINDFSQAGITDVETNLGAPLASSLRSIDGQLTKLLNGSVEISEQQPIVTDLIQAKAAIMLELENAKAKENCTGQITDLINLNTQIGYLMGILGRSESLGDRNFGGYASQSSTSNSNPAILQGAQTHIQAYLAAYAK